MDRRRYSLVTGVFLVGGCFDAGVVVPGEASGAGSSMGSSTALDDQGLPPTTEGAGSDSTTRASAPDTTAGPVDPDSSSGSSPTPSVVAADDAYLSMQGAGILAVEPGDGLLRNDTPEGTVVVVMADMQTARGGILATEPGGGFTYQAPDGFWGVDSFEYTIEGDGGAQSSASVSIYVRPIVAPVAELPTHEAGFTIIGKSSDQLPVNVQGRLGGDLRSVGDWDGDGIEDLGVVANHTNRYGEGSSGTDNEGPVYIVLGGAYSGDPEPSELDNNQGGFAIQGGVGDNSDPATVAGGDFDGDGARDLAIVSPFVNLLGAAFVLHGDQTTTSFNLTTWDYDVDGFRIDSFPRALVGIGDFTGDGRDELAFDGCRVIFGADAVASFSGTTLPDGVGFSLSGAASCAVEPLADVDGDGQPELLMYVADDPMNARAYVMWSQPAPVDMTLDELVAADEGYTIFDSGLGNFYGDWRWVSGGGDVDGDGRGDILINADNTIAVAYGKDTAGAQNAVDFYGGVDGFRINTDGVAAGAARIVGDVNGDGRADILIVRPEVDRAYVLYGGPALQRDLPDAAGDGLDGFVIEGIDLGARMRTTSGDWNGDGLADVAFGAQDSQGNRGAVHVVYGVRTALEAG